MDTSWWKTKDELDDIQKEFILLPPDGRIALEGPPGSGKTNLLLLRAQYIAGQGDKNILVLTYTKALSEFMRRGVAAKGIISGEQVKTFHAWVNEHVKQYLDEWLVPEGGEFTDEVRERAVEMLERANQHIPTPKLYQAIFVDEAQDFTQDELGKLLGLSDKVCICGDSRQGIYQRDGMLISDKIGLRRYILKNHYRIGHKIARVADRLMPPPDGEDSLESTSNYNAKLYGASSARMHDCGSRSEQFDKMCELLAVQLDAYKGDSIGILCAKRETMAEVIELLKQSDFGKFLAGSTEGFGGDKVIHVMTMHSAKGLEFRAVHMFGVEEMKHHPLNRTKLAYTTVTRAKTALNAYRTGPTSKALEAAFSEPVHVELDDIFPG
jgi:superfamily I DNA/RNA helicase